MGAIPRFPFRPALYGRPHVTVRIYIILGWASIAQQVFHPGEIRVPRSPPFPPTALVTRPYARSKGLLATD